jgi:two-component system NtrC family sensor kinase
MTGVSSAGLERIERERDQLLLLHEALADVERARTLDERLRILAEAIQRIGFARVETTAGYSMPPTTRLVAQISNSSFLDSNELLVPLRTPDGATIATLILGEPGEAGVPPLSRVRTVELFAQQVASMIENARLYEQSQRERGRGEAIADIARAISGSLHLGDVMQLSLRHAMALLRTEGATLALSREQQIIVVAGAGAGECLIGAPIPMDGSISGQAVRERRAIICNDTRVAGAYGPSRMAAGIDRTLVAPLYSSAGAIGVLAVINRDVAFGDEDALVLQRLADQVAVAVANARLYEEAHAAAERYRQVSEDERRARREAAVSEARYTRLIESASDAIFTVDLTGRLTSLNEALERASGCRRDDLMQSPFVDLIDPRDQTAVVDALAETFAGQRRRVELRYPSATRELRYCSLTLTPSIDDGAVSGALGVVRDVTDEKRLTEQLIQQEKLAAVGQLVSGVAHELNNPLASVLAFGQLLLIAPEGQPADRAKIEAMTQEAKRAAKIVSNLLTFARQHQPERTVTDLNRVIQDTLELHRYALRVANINVELQLDLALPATWADPFQLQQVMLNLIVNAEHALAAWDGERRICVCTERHAQGRTLRIRLTDTGPGIAPDVLPRIFNPFFTTKPVGEGTGLGLSISDGIVREHGGGISAESRVGHGTAFTIDLPYVAPPDPVSAGPASADPPVANPRKRLLVVDDEAPIRQAVAIYFESLGHTVDVASTGREAIARVGATHYDAVMLDLRLPDMMGDQALAQMERLPRGIGRVVFVTGDTTSDSARRVLEATGRPTISKPFLLDELAAVVLAEADR